MAIGKVKGHATDAMVASGKVVKRDQGHNDHATATQQKALGTTVMEFPSWQSV